MLADELRMDDGQTGSYSGPEGGFWSFTKIGTEKRASGEELGSEVVR
jgi:hypothetical protein